MKFEKCMQVHGVIVFTQTVSFFSFAKADQNDVIWLLEAAAPLHPCSTSQQHSWAHAVIGRHPRWQGEAGRQETRQMELNIEQNTKPQNTQRASQVTRWRIFATWATICYMNAKNNKKMLVQSKSTRVFNCRSSFIHVKFLKKIKKSKKPNA